jgi:hypothetical protein
MISEGDIIVINLDAAETCPHPALDLVWSRVLTVLKHYACFNADEARVRAQQHAILRTGILITPSIFGDGSDFCRRSFYYQQHIFYHFEDGPEEYFWITSLLDRGYSLGVLFLADRGVAISLYPYTVDVHLLRGFEDLRAAIPQSAAPSSTQIIVVVGYHHIIHTLWNELPALDYAIKAGLTPHLRIATTHQPMGPIEDIFPELRGRVKPYKLDSLQGLNGTAAMFVALGTRSIPASTQTRVRRTARELTPRTILKQQDDFRRHHNPIFWLSVKPPERTYSEQPKMLAAIIRGIQAEHPHAGFLLNGMSYPWDYHGNSNYLEWFFCHMECVSIKTMKVIMEVLRILPRHFRTAVRVVTDVSVMEETTWGEIADCYFCHGGSMQNKMDWIQSIPGVTRSNKRFNDAAKAMSPPVHSGSKTYYLPQSLVEDDDPARYTPYQLARKDQNYRFVSVEAVVRFILDAYSESRSASFDNLQPGEHSGEGYNISSEVDVH